MFFFCRLFDIRVADAVLSWWLLDSVLPKVEYAATAIVRDGMAAAGDCWTAVRFKNVLEMDPKFDFFAMLAQRIMVVIVVHYNPSRDDVDAIIMAEQLVLHNRT